MDYFVHTAFRSVCSNGLFAIPIANTENVNLFEEYEDILLGIQSARNEFISTTRRVELMKDHQSNVAQATLAVTAMLKISGNNLFLEEQLLAASKRTLLKIRSDFGKLKSDLENTLQKTVEFENKIFTKRMEIYNLQESLNIKTSVLDDWMKLSERMYDDLYMIKRFKHRDDHLLENLFIKIEKLSYEKKMTMKSLDKVFVDVCIQGFQMEKLKLEVRNELEERRYALNLWEKVVLRWQNRDNELEELLQSTEELDSYINEKIQERSEQEKYLENARKDTSCSQMQIKKLEKQLKAIKERSTDLQRHISDTHSQFQTLKVMSAGSLFHLKSLQSMIKGSRETASFHDKKLNDIGLQIKSLRERSEQISKGKVSEEQLVKEAARHLEDEEKCAKRMRNTIENLHRIRHRMVQERKSLAEKRNEMENLISNSRNKIKKVSHQICDEEATLASYERTIYEQDYNINRLEKRMCTLQHETLSIEVNTVQKGIKKLSTEFDRLEDLQRNLLEETCALQTESRRVGNEIGKLSLEKSAADSQREDDEIYIKQTEKFLKKCKSEYNQILVDKTVLQLKLWRSQEKLSFYSGRMLNFGKERLEMETYVRQRLTGFSMALETAIGKLRLVNDDRTNLKKEIRCRLSQVDRLMIRYEIESPKMDRSADEGLKSQAHYVIKALREMNELKSYGDKLDQEIEESEKELEALQNTLAVLKESNREVEPGLLQERDTLELKYKELRGIAAEKRKRQACTLAKLQTVQEALQRAEGGLLRASESENELKIRMGKLKEECVMLSQRVSRATRCLGKLKRAAQKAMPSARGLTEADIALKLMGDFNAKLLVLLMSRLRELRGLESGRVEAHGRTYLAAAGITEGSGAGIFCATSVVDITSSPSAASSTLACCNVTHLFPVSPMPSVCRTVDLSETVILPGEVPAGEPLSGMNAREGNRVREYNGNVNRVK